VPERRTLDYDRIDAIMPDVDRLLAGHAMTGRWTLGENLDHLAKSITLGLRGRRPDAPEVAPTPEQDAARRAFFEARGIPAGRELPSRLLEPEPGADPHAAAESLRKAIGRLVAFEGAFPDHPILGPLTRDEWLQFHCIHCAHHLSHAVPA